MNAALRPPADAAEALFMLRLPVEQHALVQFAQRFGLFRSEAPDDEGYLVHALFAALFGPVAPKPFAVPQPSAREKDVLPILAYATHDCGALEQQAAAFADPAVYATIRWQDAAAKPMPPFPKDARLGFELRFCPIRRLARGAPRRTNRERVAAHVIGAEVDVFQAQWLGPEPPVAPLSRVASYLAWLKEQLARENGARVVDARLIAFRRTRLARRGRERPGGTRPLVGIERPDATFQGLLDVTDSAAFRHFLARGVGRHRAFGFGMMLLRRSAEQTE